jgi:hypothetical protein
METDSFKSMIRQDEPQTLVQKEPSLSCVGARMAKAKQNDTLLFFLSHNHLRCSTISHLMSI